MSVMDWTPEKMLQIQFTKKINKEVVKNAELYPVSFPISGFLSNDEICVVRIMADDDSEYYLTDHRFISLSDMPITVLQYREVIDCDLWFPDDPNTVTVFEWENDELSAEEKFRAKRIYLSRILVTLKDGNQFLLTGLGDSAEIVRRFLGWLAKKNALKKGLICSILSYLGFNV